MKKQKKQKMRNPVAKSAIMGKSHPHKELNPKEKKDKLNYEEQMSSFSPN